MVNASVNLATRGLGVAVIFTLLVSGCLDDGEKAQSCSIDSDCSSGEICSSDLCITGIRPAVGEQSPLPGAIAVAIDAPIILGFTTPMDREATESNLMVTQGAEDIPGTIAWNNGDQSLVFTPSSSWNYNTVNKVRLGVGAISKDGHSLAVPVSFEFTTDIRRASILQTIPVDGATGLGVSPLLSLHFSEPMEAETKSQIGLTDSSGELPIAVAAYWNENATVLYIRPTLSLSSGETYILTAPKDLGALSGNPLDAEYQVSFSIGEYSDTVAPAATVDSIDAPIAIADLIENTLLLSGTFSDDSQVEWVGVEVVVEGDSPAGEWLQATTTETGWSYAWQPLLLEPQPQGNYDVYARVVDSAGNAVEGSTSLQIDVRAPLAASFAVEFPDSWKFETLPIAVIAEEGASLAVTQDDVPLEGSPFLVGTDDVGLTLTLPEIGLSATLQFLVTDAAGNPAAEAVTQAVLRTGYSCLSAANGFPVPDVEVVSQADDEEGNVQITYRLGEGAVDDTYINSSGGSGVNHGIEQYIGVGMSPDNKWLMKLPDSFFPACATIAYAKVSYQIQPSNCENCPSPTSLDAYVLLRDWDEREVTWDEVSLGVSWENAGASGALDAETLPIGLMVEEESGPVFSIELTSLAQLWANAKIGAEPMSENRGLLLYPSESGTRTIYSSETGSPQLRPTLELNFVESP